MSAPFYKTPRLDLHKTELSHLPFYKILYKSEEITRYIGGPLADIEIEQQVARRIERWKLEGVGGAAAALRDTDVLIGVGGLGKTAFTGSDELEVGYIVAPAYQGHGYAQELCSGLAHFGFMTGAAKVIATPHPENEASIQVLTRAGFKFAKIITQKEGPLSHSKERSIWELRAPQ